MVVGALAHYALLYSMLNLNATQINIHYSLIWEFKLYMFELSNNAVVEANFVFWFGAQFDSTHNFTQSG